MDVYKEKLNITVHVNNWWVIKEKLNLVYILNSIDYLYVRLLERFFPPARKSCNALITSSEGYHKWACGLSEAVCWNKYLLFPGGNKLIFFWVLDTPVSEFVDGSQSGNITMKSWLWSWHNWQIVPIKIHIRCWFQQKELQYNSSLSIIVLRSPATHRCTIIQTHKKAIFACTRMSIISRGPSISPIQTWNRKSFTWCQHQDMPLFNEVVQHWLH